MAMTVWAGLKTSHRREGLLHHITWQTYSQRPQSQPLQGEATKACVSAGATNCQKLSKTLPIAGVPWQVRSYFPCLHQSAASLS